VATRRPAPVSARDPAVADPAEDSQVKSPQRVVTQTAEIGGPKGPEPTRYGDWERNGRCSDF
jgi:hypothetical protein